MDFEQSPNKQEQIQYPEIAREMAEMVRVDQEMRAKLEEIFRTTGKSQLIYEETGIKMEDVDVPNTKRMKEIVAEIGWPTITKVGKVGAKNAWLLVQHADLDVEFQQECLDVMKELDDVDQWQIAYLTDRVLLGKGKEQLFGTQWEQDSNTGEWVPSNLADTQQAEKLRKEYGMDTLEENKKYMNERKAPNTKK